MAKVALADAGGIETKVLEDILEAASLPSGHLCLLIGDPDLDADFQAAAFARKLLPSGGHAGGLSRYLKIDWDCGVVVGKAWADRQSTYPAYFAYLLGHELGHATTMLADVALAAFENLVWRHIKKASGGRVTQYHELPFEDRYDQFGLSVTEKIYGRSAINGELRLILDRNLTDARDRAERLISLPSREDLGGLRKELADFALPYKEELVALWEEERDEARRVGGRPAMSDRIGLDDLRSLWAPGTG